MQPGASAQVLCSAAVLPVLVLKADAGPDRAAGLVDGGIGGIAESGVASQIQVLAIGFVKQIVHTEGEAHLFVDRVSAV